MQVFALSSKPARASTPASPSGRKNTELTSCSWMGTSPVANFSKLERFKEHTIDALIGETSSASVGPIVKRALELQGIRPGSR